MADAAKFLSLSVRPALKRFSTHALFCAVACYFPLLVVGIIYYCDGARICGDSLPVLAGAQSLVVHHAFPLVGNGVFLSFRLGPLAYLLAALPQFIHHGLISSYFFMWALYLLSVPLFYLAVWRMLHSAPAACAGALWFGVCGMTYEDLMKAPKNTSFLPIFLAAFALLLFRRPRNWALLPLYLLVGLCMQLHLSSVCLIPAALIFLWQGRRDFLADLPWHLAGLAIIVLLHTTVLVDLYHVSRVGLTVAWAYDAVLGNWRHFKGAFFFETLWECFVFSLPLWIAFPALLLRKSRNGSPAKELAVKLVLIVAMESLAAGVFVVLKDEPCGPRYLLSAMPFLCLGLASAVRASVSGGRRFAILFPAAAMVLALATLARPCRTCLANPAIDIRISTIHAADDRLQDWLREQNIASISGFDGDWRDVFPCGLRRVYPANFNGAVLWRTAFCLEHPDHCRGGDSGKTIRLVTFRALEPEFTTKIAASPALVFSEPHGCAGPFPIAFGVIAYFCEGPRDPVRRDARADLIYFKDL